MTGNFVPSNNFSQPSSLPQVYQVSVPNLKNTYSTDESPQVRLFIRGKNYNPAVVLTASSDPNGLVVTKGYFSIRNDRTEEVVLPFGTGTVETTRLSYDQRGNYFNFFMKTLVPGNVYRLVFLFNADGQKQLIDPGFKFRIT